MVALAVLAVLIATVTTRNQVPAPAPTATPAPASPSVRVTSVAALLDKLADNSVTEIVVANGTYVVPNASSSAGQTGGLWIDQRFAGRSSPVLVRAETIGGVTFSGGGTTNWVGIAFRDGVHDQTWQGFRFANAEPTSTGVIVFGQSGSVTPVPPHHITLLDITVEESITSDNPVGTVLDHAVYFSKAQAPGVHDILIDRLTVKAATSGLDSAIHFFHSAAGTPNANNVTIRHLNVTGTDQAVILWDPTLYDIVVEDSAITGASRYAVRYEEPGSGIVVRRVTSTGSVLAGFYSSRGSNPPGVTFVDSSLR